MTPRQSIVVAACGLAIGASALAASFVALYFAREANTILLADAALTLEDAEGQAERTQALLDAGGHAVLLTMAREAGRVSRGCRPCPCEEPTRRAVQAHFDALGDDAAGQTVIDINSPAWGALGFEYTPRPDAGTPDVRGVYDPFWGTTWDPWPTVAPAAAQ